MQKVILSLVVLGCAAGCANESGARMGLTSATAPVIAVLFDDVLVGTAVGYLDRTGTLDMQSTMDTGVRCVGEFRYTGSSTGVANIRCTDGTVAAMNFNALSSLSGYGVGSTTRGPVSFTYGLTAEQASRYLVVPKGRQIRPGKDAKPQMTQV